MAEKYTRTIVAEKLEELKRLQEACSEESERKLIEIVGIPRSTLQHWQTRQENIDADPDVIAFFTSPAGVAFLHRLVLAAHFVISFLGPCGVRLVCTFLELSGLAQFVASSYCSAGELLDTPKDNIVETGDQKHEQKTNIHPGIQVPNRAGGITRTEHKS
jgi:hypothetical protein